MMVTCSAVDGSKRVLVGPDDIQTDFPRDITHVTLQPQTREIHHNAFFSCQELVQFDIDIVATKLRTIRSKAFYNCRLLNDIAIPATVNRIQSHAFFWCESLTRISLAKTRLENIAAYAFAYCLSMEEILLPPSIKLIETCAFLDCKQLVNLEFPEGLQIIMDNAFKMCHSLEILHIPSTVTKIGPRAFANCSKIQTVEISLEGSLREIGNGAFRGCRVLDNLAIPIDTMVQSDAFRLCPRLAENLVGNLPPDYDEAMTMFLKRRFDGLPLHRLCYSISYNTEMDRKLKMEQLLTLSDDTSWYKQRDPLRQSPGHLLALASHGTPENSYNADLVFAIFSQPIQALGLEHWRTSMYRKLDDYTNALNRQERIFQIDQILSKLESLGLMEATSLLEEALWKSTMQSRGTDSPNMDSAGYLDDPELRRQCFLQCGSHIVINCVLQFVLQTRTPIVPFFGDNPDDQSFSNETAISW